MFYFLNKKSLFLFFAGFLAFAGVFFGSESIYAESSAGISAQLYNYVESTNHFDLSNLSVDQEANLTLGTGESTDIVWRVIRVMGTLAGTFAVLLYIVAGFFLITAAGDDGRLGKGKTIAELTTIGLVFIFGAYIIVQFTLSLIFAV